jgi:ribose transport system substrate-binding protein
MVEGGLIERTVNGGYRSLLRPSPQRLRIGYAAQTTDSTFSLEVTRGLERAASEHNVELLTVNNRYSAAGALRAAEKLLAEKPDLVIEFQTYANVAPVVASHFLSEGIPVIALEIPHPGAVYFGADNYAAGQIGGRALAEWVRRNWHGELAEVLLIEEAVAGPLPGARVTSMYQALCAAIPGLQQAPAIKLDGKGSFGPSFEVVRRRLRKVPPQRTLIVANNDPSTLGALRAFEEAGRQEFCATVGLGGIREGREELLRPGTRLVACVTFFPERFGDHVIPLALAILAGKPIPGAQFIKHELLTRNDVSRIYPESEL